MNGGGKTTLFTAHPSYVRTVVSNIHAILHPLVATFNNILIHVPVHCRWSTHPTVRHLRQCESVDLVPSVQGVEDGSGEGGEREGVDAPVVQGAQDQEPQRQRVNCQMSPKRPSWWRVLIGSHWKKIQEQQRGV